jgi:hypothetical protein
MMEPRTTLYAMAVLMLPSAVHGPGVGGMRMDDPAGAAAHEAMAGNMTENAHMRMTPMRTPTRADPVRAMAVADTLRRALAKNLDPAAAERDGFKLFAPNVKKPESLSLHQMVERAWRGLSLRFGMESHCSGSPARSRRKTRATPPTAGSVRSFSAGWCTRTCSRGRT